MCVLRNITNKLSTVSGRNKYCGWTIAATSRIEEKKADELDNEDKEEEEEREEEEAVGEGDEAEEENPLTLEREEMTA